jgi:CRISPR-associated protein Cas1
MNILKTAFDLSTLSVAFERVRQNNGCAGVDGVGVSSFAKDLSQRLTLLANELASNSYKPNGLKQTLLPREGKEPRPLVIPTVRDRIVHTAIALAIQPHLEKHFEDCSWGYRPGRCYLDAVDKITEYRKKGYHWLLDADIRQFFDNICQQSLLAKLHAVLPDRSLNRFINQCLFSMQKAGQGLMFGAAKGKGIPQGSPLSPLLANLYLTDLDKAYKQAKFALIRYADDFVVCTHSRKEAEYAFALAEKHLGELHLKLNKDKTQITNFTEGFRFLGHSFVGDLVIDDSSQQALSKPLVSAYDDVAQVDAVDLSLDIALENKLSSPTNEALLALTNLDLPSEEKLKLAQPCRLKTMYLTEPGCVVSLNGHRLIISKSRKTIGQMPLATLALIVIMTRCQLTTDVYIYCLKHSIAVVFCSQLGGVYGALDDFSLSELDVITHQVKYLRLNKALPLSRSIVDTKLHNSAVIIRRFCRKRNVAILSLEQLNQSFVRSRNQLKKVKSLAQIRGIEGQAASTYFKLWRELLPDEWHFKTRNRRPPKDPVNVLLSLGYTMLFNNIHALIKGRGLCDLLGVLHVGNRQPNLVLDLMEVFRAVIVDALVLKLLLNRHFSPTDFTQREGRCVLNVDTRRRFVKQFEQKMQSQLIHPVLGFPTDYRRLIDWQVCRYKAVIIGNETTFETVKLR